MMSKRPTVVPPEHQFETHTQPILPPCFRRVIPAAPLKHLTRGFVPAVRLHVSAG